MTTTIPKPASPEVDGPEWTWCGACRTPLYGKRWIRNLKVCPECGRHGALTAPERLGQLLDPGSIEPLPFTVHPNDPLRFADTKPYPHRLASARAQTGLTEAVVGALGTIEGSPVAVACMDFRFLGGSLSAAVGEIITRIGLIALRRRIALLLVTASGGARMQEGALSLMQMAKTSAMLARLDAAGIFTISLITDPTFGGVAASFATICDVTVAEPGARLGFAGRRVIEHTIGEKLPSDFQTAEFLLERGFIDFIAPRATLRRELSTLLRAGTRDRRAPVRLRTPKSLLVNSVSCCATPSQAPRGVVVGADTTTVSAPPRKTEPADAPNWTPLATEVSSLTGSNTEIVVRDPARLPERDAATTVRLARRITRPTTLDYVAMLFDEFRELAGDRASGDCPAMVGGVGRLHGRPVVLIGHQKGHDPAELTRRNFGMPNPAGYRKAARLMRLAAKLRVPVIALIDTPGAYPGKRAEEQGQAIAIAENLKLMAALPVPVVAVITGEGGSGGALALGVANRVLMWQDAVYSVISPEGCAAILWQDPSASAHAAEALKLRAKDLLALGVVDGVILEPDGGVDAAPVAAAERLGVALAGCLAELSELSGQRIRTDRRARFDRFGADSVSEGAPDDFEDIENIEEAS